MMRNPKPQNRQDQDSGRASLAELRRKDLPIPPSGGLRRTDAEPWRKLNCSPKPDFRCEDSPRGTKEQPVVHLILNRDRNTVCRCDAKGSADFEAAFVSGGMYTNIPAAQPRGVLVKVVGNSDYVEVAASGLVTHNPKPTS